MRRFTVILDWEDAHVYDADEIAVWAATSAEAVRLARSIWAATKGAEWPNCRLVRAYVLRGVLAAGG